VAWTARASVVGHILLGHCAIVLAVLGPPFAVALIEGAHMVAAGLAPGLALSAAGAFAAWRRPAVDDVRHIEAVTALAAMFIIVSLLPVPAFIALGMPCLDAVFESVSGITSTGLTVALGAMDWPFAGHFLRAWLQWSGGFAIAVAGVALLLGPGPAARQMGEVGIEGRNLLSSTRAQARQLLAVYCVITVIAIAVLSFMLPSAWEGLVVALAAVSTGGFTPRPDSLASYSQLSQIVVILICLSTTMSLFFYVLLRNEGLRKALTRSNAGSVLVSVLSGAVFVTAAKFAVDGWRTDDVLPSLLNFVSGFTTAGLSVQHVDDADVLVALLLLAMLIGGGIGSTSGGIKLDRAVTLMRMVGLSLLRLRAPRRAVTHLTERGKAVEADAIISIGAIIALYCATAFVAWIIFLASGMAPLASLFDVVSALSTVGLSTGVTGPDMADHLKLVLIVAMLAGRLEFLALLALILPATWNKRT
jgi:trk system potassium uptake protein